MSHIKKGSDKESRGVQNTPTDKKNGEGRNEGGADQKQQLSD
jgi:hypothetical protein